MNPINRKIAFAVAVALNSVNALAAGSVIVDNTINGKAGNTMIPLVGGSYTIPASEGVVKGTGTALNLYESFNTFNVDTGETAFFTNDTANLSGSFANILARVTGGTPTTINGTINSTAFPNAKMWLINPTGVTMGQGATLNVPGGFASSAADFISFTNGDRWYAIDANGTAGNPSVLSVSNAASFGFLSNVTVDATLTSGPANTGTITGTPNASGNTYTIATNYGVTSGNNEFFSFQNFDVGTNDSANFLAAANVTNILARVTGSSVTNIDGTISSPASLWLINPSGILVGPHAVLNISGALGLGAADYINLTDALNNTFYFYASPSSTSTALTSTSNPVPQSFGFSAGSVAQGLTLQGASSMSSAGCAQNAAGCLSAGPGDSITLAANGPVSITGYSIDTLPSGSTAGQSTGAISISSNSATVSLNGSMIATSDTGTVDLNTGAISIAAASTVSLSGSNLSTGGVSQGGAITIGGAGVLISNSSDVQTNTICAIYCGGPSGNISIEATGSATEQSPQMNLATATPGVVRIVNSGLNDSNVQGAPTIAITGEDIVLSQAALISKPVSSGGGGTIMIGNSATNAVWIQNATNVDADTINSDGGIPGVINIQAGANGGGISVLGVSTLSAAQGTFSNSHGGYDITLNSGSGPLLIQNSSLLTTSQFYQGAGINLTGASIQVSDSQLKTTASYDSSSAGAISLEATAPDPTGRAAVLIDGQTTISSAASISDLFSTPASGGDITIKADTGTVNIGPASITSSVTQTAGSAGSIMVTGDTVTLTTGALLSSTTTGSGPAGPITISGSGLTSLSGATVSAQSTGGTGNAGPISISGSGVLINGGSIISSNYSGGNQGAPGSVAIFANGATATGDPLSGDLSIARPGDVRIVDSAVTATNSGGTGAGNNGTLGQIWIGTDLPGESGAVSDNVVIAGSVVSTDVSAGGTGSNLTVQASNSVWIGPSPTGGYPILAADNLLGVNDVRTSQIQSLIGSQTDESAASPGQIAILSGAGGITVSQSIVAANNAFIAMNGGLPNSVSADIQVSATGGPVDLMNAGVTAQTTGIDAGGHISVSGQTVSVTGGSISASSNPIATLAQFSTYAGGDAGKISITATGADPSATVYAIQVEGGASISSTANGVAATGTNAAVEAGNAGTVALTANLGTVQVGSTTDSVSTPNVIGTSANVNAGEAGAISLAGQNIGLIDTQLLTTVSQGAFGDTRNTAVPPASVELYATPTFLPNGTVSNGSISLNNSLIDTRTSGAVDAGSVTLIGNAISISGGQQPAHFSIEESPDTAIFSGTSGPGNAGSIFIDSSGGPLNSPGGPLTITGASIAADAGFGASGEAGNILLTGVGIDLESATVSTAAVANSLATGAPSLVSLSSVGGGTVTLNNSLIDTTTGSPVAGGSVQISGSAVTITGGQQPTVFDIADTIPPPNTAIFSGTGGSGAAGPITISATEGPVKITDATISAESGGGGGSGGAGSIKLSGASVDLEGSTLSSVSESDSLLTATPAAIAVTGLNGGAVTLNNSLLDTLTTGSVPAGSITVLGGSVSITGGPASGPTRGGEAGLPGVSANTAIYSNTLGSGANSGNAGDITVSATALSNVPSATGLVTISGAVLSSQSNDSTGNGGYISVSGSNVLVTQQSSLSASTTGSGNAGAISVTASGADPTGGSALVVTGGSTLESDASQGQSGANGMANAGTVTLMANNGSVQVGAAQDPAQSNVLSTVAGPNAGEAGKLTISGDAITVNQAQLLTTASGSGAAAQAGAATTISLITNGAGGPVSISNSKLDATTAGMQVGGDITLTGTAVGVTASTLASSTAGVTNAGDIDITGTTVDLVGTKATAATTGSGNAGAINVAASGADPTGGSALAVTGGSTLASDASAGQSGANGTANAGSVTLIATSGSVQVGTSQDPTQSNILSTVAGSNTNADAGAAGTVKISGNAITVNQAQLLTTAFGTTAAAANGAKGTISLSTNNSGTTGPVTVNSSTLDASTSGSQTGGDIILSGTKLAISDSQIQAQTTGGANAGSIDITGSSVSIDPSTISTSTNSTGNAGTITITANPGALSLASAVITSTSSSALPGAGLVGSITLSGGSVSITGNPTQMSQISVDSSGGTPGESAPGSTSTNTPGTLTTGAITINSTGGTAPILIGDSQVTATSAVTDGSNIVINAGGSPLFLQSGTINATAGGKGNGGDVTINDVGATVVQGSRIIANASGGDGGAININLNKNSAFVEDTQSEISATSLTGNNGTVTINAPQTDLNSALHPAEVGVTQAPELSANACAPGTNRSTFVRDEHGGIAPAPDDYLTGQGPLLSAATQAWPTDFKPDAILPNLKQLVASADSGCR